MSLTYFENGDKAFCLDSYSITVTSPEPLPDWISVNNAEFTVTSGSPFDVPISTDVTISVEIAGQTTEATFKAELVCE